MCSMKSGGREKGRECTSTRNNEKLMKIKSNNIQLAILHCFVNQPHWVRQCQRNNNNNNGERKNHWNTCLIVVQMCFGPYRIEIITVNCEESEWGNHRVKCVCMWFLAINRMLTIGRNSYDHDQVDGLISMKFTFSCTLCSKFDVFWFEGEKLFTQKI